MFPIRHICHCIVEKISLLFYTPMFQLEHSNNNLLAQFCMPTFRLESSSLLSSRNIGPGVQNQKKFH